MQGFARFFIRRLLLLLPLLIAMAILMFLLMRLLPGCPAAALLGPGAEQEEIDTMREKMGLDEPIHRQLFIWLGSLVRGDLGYSYFQNRPVNDIIVDHLGPTLKLTLISFGIAIVFGTAFGMISAVKQHTIIDRALIVFAVSGMAVPQFWFALLIILLFSVVLGWFPVAGYYSFGEAGFGSIKYLVLPIFALCKGQVATLTRMVRARMLDVLHQDYVLTARSKGLPYTTVIIKHAFKNTMVTMITVCSMILAVLLGGSVIIETIFAIPGIGRLIVLSIARRDYTVVQAGILLITTSYLVLNFIADILYSVVDPRITY